MTIHVSATRHLSRTTYCDATLQRFLFAGGRWPAPADQCDPIWRRETLPAAHPSIRPPRAGLQNDAPKTRRRRRALQCVCVCVCVCAAAVYVIGVKVDDR